MSHSVRIATSLTTGVYGRGLFGTQPTTDPNKGKHIMYRAECSTCGWRGNDYRKMELAEQEMVFHEHEVAMFPERFPTEEEDESSFLVEDAPPPERKPSREVLMRLMFYRGKDGLVHVKQLHADGYLCGRSTMSVGSPVSPHSPDWVKFAMVPYEDVFSVRWCSGCRGQFENL